mmetsp:Transcript_23268/g.34468  ORF Transcript_23268/g.34468 Transcript_23268/m.34468 type:complete len:182 (+) Transcript_23268:153-698(+)
MILLPLVGQAHVQTRKKIISTLCSSTTSTTSTTKKLHYTCCTTTTSSRLAKIRQAIDHNMPNGKKRYFSGSKISACSSSKNTKNKVEDAINRTPQQQADLKWTEREEAPWWLQKMAPYKGATKLPNKMETVILSIVTVLGYYAWFVDSGSAFVDSESSNDVIATGAGAGDNGILGEASQER